MTGPACMPPDGVVEGCSAIRSAGMFRPCASVVKYRLTSLSRSAPLEVYAAAAAGASLSHTSSGFWCFTAVFLLGAGASVPPMEAVAARSPVPSVRGVGVVRMWAMFAPARRMMAAVVAAMMRMFLLCSSISFPS